MIRPLIACGTSFALVACDSTITDATAYPSPGGGRVLVVVEETQGANDSTPWWTHVSLRDSGDHLKRIPGNLLKLEGRGPVHAKWISETELTVTIHQSIWHDDKLTTPVSHQGVTIRFVRSPSRNP